MHAGHDARIVFTLQYASPEVIAAHQARQAYMEASAASDMWSFGMIAYELLTGERVFHRFEADRDDCTAQLLGHAPLPWEHECNDALLKRMRALRKSVLSCLSRDPLARPTSEDLLVTWQAVYEGRTRTAVSSRAAEQRRLLRLL